MNDLAKFESELWEAADNLRANSKLTSSDYFMPVLGVIFLRHAANRFDAATKQIEADQAAGTMPKRKLQAADYVRRRALFLPEVARYDWIMAQATTSAAGLPTLVIDAMNAIEKDFEPLKGVLPKDYGIFEPSVLEGLMRTFNSEQVKHATGDVFGRIYEYFLAKFSIQKAHDNGEFFTPASIVQLIVNVIEPDHGIVFDPACGSGGMFVQSSHFIEHEGGDTTKKVVFYGQEKNRDTIRIAKMNLAVHGLEGKIAEAITYYQDEHNLAPTAKMAPGGCDFVMANPPFNVDLVDEGKVKADVRLPFGLPGVTQGKGTNDKGEKKAKTVSNANYLWISYFYSYLNATGRAGFVMSSQACVISQPPLSRMARSSSHVLAVAQIRMSQPPFVSVTQAFNTTHSMGRLTLNILLSFAQFEREIISERTRDKIAAARRKGKWSGGKPLLGYDILSLPTGAKLVVNEDEAHRVRQIFELYLQHHALIPTLKEVTSRGWTNKRWVTRKGGDRGGRPFDKGTLYKLLTSRTYCGQVTYHDEVHPGEHPAIVEKVVWDKVQAVLGRNGNTGGAVVRNKYGALLKGLISCACCRCSMIPTYTSKGGKRYRYYVCLQAQKQGWHSCPSKSVPAGQIEQFVVEQIKRVGKDPLLLEGTLRQMRQQRAKELADLQAEQRGLEREVKRHHAALQKLAAAPAPTRLVGVMEALRKAEQRSTTIRTRSTALEREHVEQSEVAAALSAFDPVWGELSPKEQARVLQLLVQRVAYDGKQGTVAITFHPGGIKTLAAENNLEEAA